MVISTVFPYHHEVEDKCMYEWTVAAGERSFLHFVHSRLWEDQRLFLTFPSQLDLSLPSQFFLQYSSTRQCLIWDGSYHHIDAIHLWSTKYIKFGNGYIYYSVGPFILLFWPIPGAFNDDWFWLIMYWTSCFKAWSSTLLGEYKIRTFRLVHIEFSLP